MTQPCPRCSRSTSSSGGANSRREAAMALRMRMAGSRYMPSVSVFATTGPRVARFAGANSSRETPFTGGGAAGEEVRAPRLPRPPPAPGVFRFRYFDVAHDAVAHKVGTDAMLLGAWAHPRAARRILDIGTGSGVLALMAAQRALPDALVDAIDVDAAAVAQAAANAASSPWRARVAVHHASLQAWAGLAAQEGGAAVGGAWGAAPASSGDGLGPSSGSSMGAAASGGQGCQAQQNADGGKVASGLGPASPGAECTTPRRTRQYDFIISNPPFFLGSSKPPGACGRRAAARHADVLLPFAELAAGASALLAEGGRLCVVLPPQEALRFERAAAEAGLGLASVLRVRSRATDAAAKRHLLELVRAGKEAPAMRGARDWASSACHGAGGCWNSEAVVRGSCSSDDAEGAANAAVAVPREAWLSIYERRWVPELGSMAAVFTAEYRSLTAEFHDLAMLRY